MKRGNLSLDLSGLTETTDTTTQQIIVKLKPDADMGAIAALKASLGAVTVETTQSFGFELWETATPISEEMLQAIADVSLLETVDYLQPNYTLSVQTTPFQDPGLPKLWGLDNQGQQGGNPDADIDAPEAWEISTGAGVVVAVIDSGVDYTHPDLAANLWVNPGEIANNGIDDDGNGYVDDVHGYDFANNDGDPMDDNGHGTHVAGTIAAVGNNNQGIVGVAPNAQIMALKFLAADGSGSTFDAIQAVEYAVLMGADITNNSWGGGAFSRALSDAIATAGNAGQLFVAAAGNSQNNNDAFLSFPASYSLDAVISVAASTRQDRLAAFSNFGQMTVDLAAPGDGIYSTLPGGQYGTLSGTSMAAPHVAGVAALVWAADPSLTALEVKQRILDHVDLLPALTPVTLTGGRLNAYAALNVAPPAPVDPVPPPAPVPSLPRLPDWWRNLAAGWGSSPSEAATLEGDDLLGDRPGVLLTSAFDPDGEVAADPSADSLINQPQAIAPGTPLSTELLTLAAASLVGSRYWNGEQAAHLLSASDLAEPDFTASLSKGAIAHLVHGLQDYYG
ncbi:MAG: S8 family peptidase [Synechococcales bacterium]|nr:S8 family peptidase [Synechococcales bacterium]